MAFGGTFGSAPTPAFGQQAQPAFGATNSLFGQQQQQQQQPLFAAQSTANNGTRAVPYQLSTLHDHNNPSAEPGKYLTITAMEAYHDRSVEELRLEDYSRNDRGGEQTANTPSANAFAQQNPQSASLFAANSSSAFANSTPSLFASSTPALFGASQQSNTPFGAQSASAFGAQSASAFGAQSASAFGAQSASAFGAQSASAFAPQSTSAFASQSASAFGAQSASAFGAQSASAFGAAGSLFGSQSTPASSPSLFGAPASATALLGASTPSTATAGSFGAPSNAFGAPSTTPSTGLFASSAAGSLGFGGSASGLFSSSQPSLGFGSGGLFAPSSSASLFASSQSAFGSSTFGSNAFGSALAPHPVDPQHHNRPDQQAPLQTNLTLNPFGDSKLFQNLPPPAAATGPAPSVVEIPSSGQSKKVSVVLAPHRTLSSNRPRPSPLLARQMSSRRRGPAAGWFYSSPIHARNPDTSLFNVGSTNVGNRYSGPGNAQRYYTQWRTPEQIQRAANIKRLVIEPLTEDELPTSSRRTQDALNTPREVRWNRPSSMLVSNSEKIAMQTASIQQPGPDQPMLPTPRSRPASYTPRQSLRSSLRNSAVPDPAQVVDIVDVEDELPNSGLDHGVKMDERVDQIKEEEREEEIIDEKTPQAMQTDGNCALYAPYSEFYKGQMSNSRRRSSIGKAASPASNEKMSMLPKCTGRDVYIKPTMEELANMTEDELSTVKDFTFGRKNVGEIRWITPTDVRGLDLDRLIEIRTREVCVYPDDVDVPAVGSGLNKAAIVELEGVWRFDKNTKEALKDASSTALMVNKLKRHCDEEGLNFLGYDSRTGKWTFQTNSF